MQPSKLLLLFPDGTGIKNYLYADVFQTTHQCVLFHDFDPDTIAYLRTVRHFDAAVALPPYRESLREKFLRELIGLARLHWNVAQTGNTTLLENWVWKRKTLKERAFYTAVQTLAPYYASAPQLAKLDAAYQKAIRGSAFYQAVRQILMAQKPDAVFCSHQRAVKAAPVFAAAKDLGIRTTTVIYSWDNLPKGRLALRADQYLVWSDYMKDEMRRYFPDIPQQQVVVTGTPQFEFYGDSQYVQDRAAFFAAFGLDENKKTICFSGDDEMTSPDDPAYLEDLATALTHARLDGEYQILLRRCPVDVSGRYDAVLGKYPNLIRQAAPLWNQASQTGWATIYPLQEDVSLLVSTAKHCDLVVNIGSTMAFDFAMFGKPCIYINYDQELKRNPQWSVSKVYQFEHFKSMPSRDAVYWFDRKDTIAATVSQALAQGIPPSMYTWIDTVLGRYRHASETIQQTLEHSRIAQS